MVEAGYKEEREVAFLRITSLEQQKEPLQKEAEVHIWECTCVCVCERERERESLCVFTVSLQGTKVTLG